MCPGKHSYKWGEITPINGRINGVYNFTDRWGIFETFVSSQVLQNIDLINF